MGPLIVKMTALAAATAPKLQALGQGLARGFDAFTEAKIRAAVPEWRLREIQHEINRYHRLMHAGCVATEGQCKRRIEIPRGGTMRGARGLAESRPSIVARPSHPPRTSQLSSAIRRLMDRAVDCLPNLPGTGVRPYRPELHYMRGPGPRWQAKHGLSAH
jgi:hypothetical protein